MNSQVCVICHNKKPVNATDNRLVTESCGHIKCMGCLMLEKTGCLACLKSKFEGSLHSDPCEDVEPVFAKDSDEKLYDDKDTQCETYDLFIKKKKPETSHIKVETDANGKNYECTVCNKKFHARSQVAYHAYCNGQRKPYQCPECNKSFATQSHYKYHMRVHRNERTYSCDVCGDSFFQMSKLQRHKLKHTKEKKYVCNQCSKAFNNLTSLRKHGLTHTEERPYPCATCGRSFRDSSNYRKHVAKHEKKCACGGWSGWGSCGRGSCAGAGGGRGGGRGAARRPHQCPRCPQAFHSSKDMRRHAAVHTDSKPFRCKVCNRNFRRKDNLERHIRNTHSDYEPSSVVECDEAALIQIANGNSVLKQNYQKDEKSKLEILNPLPPLPPDVIQKHMHENGNKTEANKYNKDTEKTNKDEESEKSVEIGIDTSYILVANNARQSVIVKKKAPVETKSSSPNEVCEYVHKIRKASIIPLPPIDMRKMIELEEQTHLNNLEFGIPPKDKKTVYEKILYGDKEKRENEETNADSGAGIHWRRKIKQSVSVDLK